MKIKYISEIQLDKMYFRAQNYPESVIDEYLFEIKRSKKTIKRIKTVMRDYKDIADSIKKQLKENYLAGIDYVVLMKYNKEKPWVVGQAIGRMYGYETAIKHDDCKVLYRECGVLG